MAISDHEEVDLTSAMSRINAALEGSDIFAIRKVIGNAVMLHNVSEIARKAGVERTSLYRAFGGAKRLPNFPTVLSVLAAMGLRLKVVKARKRVATRAVSKPGKRA
jgi:probable addiction module antidote protein